jgi:hypothetical protein
MRPFCLLLLLFALAQAGAAQALLPYRHGSRWGYRTPAGRVAVPPRYQHAEPFRGGLAKVWRANKCGYINAQGREVIPVRWDAASYRENSVAWLGEQLPRWPAAQGWVLVMRHDEPSADERSLDGASARPPRARYSRPWQPGTAEQLAQAAQLLGFYTPQGRVVLPADYEGFQWLDSDYLGATKVVGHSTTSTSRLDGPDMLEVTSCELCPVRVAQLLHRSGRLLLQGKYFYQIAGLYGDKLVVDGDNRPNFTFPAAQLLDTTGRVLLTQTNEPEPHPLGTLVPLGAGTNLWRVTYWNEDGYAGSRDDSYHLMRPNGQLVAPEVRFFSVWAVDAQRAAGMGHRAGQSGVLAVATGEWLLQAPVVAPGVGPTLVVVTDNLFGAIQADGRPLLPIHYTRLDACHTRSGQPLPYWFAQLGQQSWLLAPDGQPVLDLHGYWLVGGEFDDNLTYDAVNWSTTQEALIRLDTTQHRSRASLTLRPHIPR